MKAPPVFQQADGLVLEVGKKQRRRNRAIAGGIGLGLLGAAIIGSQSRNRQRDYDDDDHVDEVEYERPRRRSNRSRRGGSWARHVQRCYDAYRSYNERTDTYVNYDGETRRCRK